jgi:hypothetical protein
MRSSKKSSSEKGAELHSIVGTPTVRLLTPPNRSPATPVEKLAVAALEEHEETPLALLVDRVAKDIYRDEIRAGAWTLDIGLFGSRLFARDVTRELQAADGILWKIQQREEPVQ